MSIKSQADWLRGFLESLECSDNISQRQIKILKEKLNSLLEDIENICDDDDEEGKIEVPRKTDIRPNIAKESDYSFSGDDDLPF